MSDAPFQDLDNEAPDQVYVDLDPNDPELLKLRRAAGDPTAPVEGAEAPSE